MEFINLYDSDIWSYLLQFCGFQIKTLYSLSSIKHSVRICQGKPNFCTAHRGSVLSFACQVSDIVLAGAVHHLHFQKSPSPHFSIFFSGNSLRRSASQDRMLLCHQNFLVTASVETQRKNFSFSEASSYHPREPSVCSHHCFMSSP
jgi:hypothetical protein